MADKIIRVVTRGPDGAVKEKDFDDFGILEKQHDKIGIDDCSTDLTLRGMPVFRGLIGPIPDGKNVVRYESPEVFESLTKEWSQKKAKRRRRRSSAEVNAAAKAAVPTPKGLPTVIMPVNIPMTGDLV